MSAAAKAGKEKPASGRRNFAVNRRARHDYHIEESFEAGISLTGTEVKSIRDGRINLKEGFGRVKDGQLYLSGVHISPYPMATFYNHEPLRDRRLLMHKEEIRRLESKTLERGYTIVPLSVYSNPRGVIKVEIGLARGKLQHDKRHDIADREAKREMERVRKYAGRE
ncbi:MAG: SsrA-binding protein SmpB [Candidatus Geothermincolia bacterium]